MKRIFSVIAFFVVPVFLYPVELVYKYNRGDQYRYVSRVKQEHGFLGEAMTKSEFVNRIAFRVADVSENGGRLTGLQQTSQILDGNDKVIVWKEEYPIDFWRSAQGIYEVKKDFFAPMVRNVPYFPKKKNFKPGQRWLGKGEEVHDLSQQIGYIKPFPVSVTVGHEYTGPVKRDGKDYQLVRTRYKYNKSIPKAYVSSSHVEDGVYVQRISGNHKQEFYWDEDLGHPGIHREKYEMQLHFSDGRQYIFSGKAEAHLVEVEAMDKNKIVLELKDQLISQGMSDADVRHDRKGVTLSFNNIQFAVNSEKILPGEDQKLRKIGEIIKSYNERDIIITGHTAQIDSDSREGQILSELRAKTVANFFVEGRYKEPGKLIVEGCGGRVPIADNSTDKGRIKNRRVEITILEN